MAKQKQLTEQEVIKQIKGLSLPELLFIARETATLIAEQEKEAEETLSLIRGK